MNVLLNNCSVLSDDACFQRKIVGLPVEIMAIEEDAEWFQAINENVADNPTEYKWVHTRVGPIRIKDRAAMSLKGAGFGVSSSTQKLKKWERIDGDNIHQVLMDPKGQWLHQALPAKAPDALPKNMARGEGHKSLMRHMDMSKEFQFSIPTQGVTP